ncbi:MAG: aminomethyl-transferring glycine dehydrogenase subunit GcvPB [Opitutales bacterium]
MSQMTAESPHAISGNQPPPLGYDPNEFPRELARHYVSASEEDVKSMLETVGVEKLEDLFSHVPGEVRFSEPLELPEELSYQDLQASLHEISEKTNLRTSFIGDGLPSWKVHPVISHVSNLRPLTTSYTPYQPERSQGTLMTHWIYQCVMSALTGFEAVNSSLYDRSTAIFEAICCAIRLKRGSTTAIVAETLFPEDLEVLRTLTTDTDVSLAFAAIDSSTGTIDLSALRQQAEDLGDELACIVFPQVNCLGLLEDVNQLTDLARERGVKSVACIDPMLLAAGGLKPPSEFGAEGADFLAGEAQHMAIRPNFGGPGLGVFATRHNDKVRNMVRATPGRFVGKAKDEDGRECLVMVLSTREQHIRKEKATSNVCSNQAFLATLAGAATLAKGESGMAEAVASARANAIGTVGRLIARQGVELAFPETPFFNEALLQLDKPVSEVIALGRAADLHVGVDVSQRLPESSRTNLLKISFSDLTTEEDLEKLVSFFEVTFPVPEAASVTLPEIPTNQLRQGATGLPEIPEAEIRDYYGKLAELNVSPDDACYPLGSCTMKYNPLVNDWAAGLSGFAEAHPQAPVEDVQGPLEVLYAIQEWFAKITGLPAVTTQPVAGAQGELVGLKLFQAYHRDRLDNDRDVVFIPKSAHGTNFATAVMAGFDPSTGIVHLEALPDGRVDPEDFDDKIATHGRRLCGVMITNPNTSGVFETDFKAIADKVHTAGGLVYMDGANMNAIAGQVNLEALGVDAVHNNLHKTWTIPHGGGGPGDAIVAVSQCLAEYLPGTQVVRSEDGLFRQVRTEKSIGSFHRHHGNFGHKVRALAYLLRLGKEGVPRMSALAVLSSRYLFEKLGKSYPTLPTGAIGTPRMHEFILTLNEEDFASIEAAGIPRSQAIPQVGKLFLDFGFHAPTVAFPEVYGLMIEPTESYTKAELDRFADSVIAIREIIRECPQALASAPHFTPIDRVDEVAANRNLILREKLDSLPSIPSNRLAASELLELSISEIKQLILSQVNLKG